LRRAHTPPEEAAMHCLKIKLLRLMDSLCQYN